MLNVSDTQKHLKKVFFLNIQDVQQFSVSN